MMKKNVLECEKILNKKFVFTKVFEASEDTFSAYYKACEYLKSINVSHGSMERDYPIGLCSGDVDISKWNNLRGYGWSDYKDLDGVMLSNCFREQKVWIHLTFDPNTKKENV